MWIAIIFIFIARNCRRQTALEAYLFESTAIAKAIAVVYTGQNPRTNPPSREAYPHPRGCNSLSTADGGASAVDGRCICGSSVVYPWGKSLFPWFTLHRTLLTCNRGASACGCSTSARLTTLICSLCLLAVGDLRIEHTCGWISSVCPPVFGDTHAHFSRTMGSQLHAI